MNISEFIEKNFHLTESSLISLGEDQNLINEDVEFKNDYITKKTCAAYIDEIKIHHNIATSTSTSTSTCTEILGFNELISTLKLQAPEKEIFTRFISSTSWSGYVYFDELNNFLGFLMGRKKNIGWSTPPNWDGSEKMLEEYNTKKY